MADARQVVSFGLLVLGMLLVFVGISAALGFSAAGMVASAAVIGALLYVGAVWFAPAPSAKRVAPADSLIVFDRDCRIVSGGAIGERVTMEFPPALRGEIERRCGAALSGSTSRFPCLRDGKTVLYDALPVRDANGAIVYGILLIADRVPTAIAASA
jgi:hypothetical protein